MAKEKAMRNNVEKKLENQLENLAKQINNGKIGYLYAFLDVNTGLIFGKCTENHKVETLIKIFKEHILSLPDDSVIL